MRQVREVVAEARRVERRDPVRPVRQVEAGAEEVVAVARDLRQDLAEAERHDREVVTAQAQGRKADQDPEERGQRTGDHEQREDRDMDARQVRRDADRPEVPVAVRELEGREPGGGVGAGGVEGDIPQVEQPGVADDDVQADGHHHEDEHVDARRDVGPDAEDRDHEHLREVERIEDREHDRDDGRDARASRVRHPEDREDDREQDSERPHLPEEEQDEHDLSGELVRERRQTMDPVERPDREDGVGERVVEAPEPAARIRKSAIDTPA